MDLKIVMDNNILNIRVGVIIKHNNKVLVEIPKALGNSVIPGGRVKFGEDTKTSLKREIEEEMGISLDKEKMVFKQVLENFFTFDGKNAHELFFVYEYKISDEEYDKIIKVKNNMDNDNTYFEFIDSSEFEKVNLLPKEVIEIIKDA